LKSKSISVIKIGGRAASDQKTLISLITEMKSLDSEHHFILVHGGGAEVSRIGSIFGHTPRFVHGIRMTSPEEMDIVDMVLSGKMNKYLVRLANRVTRAVGISGSDGFLFTGESIESGTGSVNHTGKITKVSTELVELLIENDFIPVISSTSMDNQGRALNINADEAALHIAAAVKADNLIFLSDIPGILHDDRVLSCLNGKEAEAAIQKEIISGGMIPKVRSSLTALREGVGHVIIGRYSGSGDLTQLIQGNRGTYLYKEHS